MICENDIVFVTTTKYSKWMEYQSGIIRKLFPDSKHIIIDGRSNWPSCWFYWIDEIKRRDETYYVHVDEDFFITSKKELICVIEKMEIDGIDVIGCSDGFHHFRNNNPVAINPFLMIGRCGDIKRLPIDLKDVAYNYLNDGSVVNSLSIKFKDEYRKDFDYKHEYQGGQRFVESEPFYIFFWLLKELGCKFDYLYPYFDPRFKSTNPRLDKSGIDIGIHMWYSRTWESDMDVFGIPNNKRYLLIEHYLNENIISL